VTDLTGSRSLVVLREADIRRLLDMASCIEAVEKSLIAYSTGGAELPAVIHLDVPEHRGEIHIKAGHLRGGPVYAVKVASGFAGNPARGLPQNDGLVIVFDAGSGEPAALLLDRGFITDLRTGAAGGVAAKHLARPDSRTVAVVGCGVQARFQLEALALVRPFREARIYGRRPERARACADEMASHPGMPEGARFLAVPSVKEAVEGADIVVTVTPSREPLVRAAWLSPGVHVTAVGSDGPDKQELDADILASADLLVVDSRDQCLRLGELHHAVAAGLIAMDKVTAELGEIAGGLRPGRRRPEEISVCDLTGVGVQDVAAASIVLSRARASGSGEPLRL
jgi:ectoine utilization protein EutC